MTDLAIDPIFSDAVIFASLLALLSIGLTLTYLTTRVPNFAHASFATVGVYIALISTRVWETTPYIAIPIAFAISGVIAVALYTFVFLNIMCSVIAKIITTAGATKTINGNPINSAS